MKNIYNQLKTFMPSGSSRSRREHSSSSYFFEKEDEFEKFLTDVNKIISKLGGDNNYELTLFEMTTDQVDAARLDAKIVFRNDLYYGKFVYRLQTQGGDDSVLDALEAQFFSEDEINSFYQKIEKLRNNRLGRVERYGRLLVGSRARLQYGRTYASTIIYVKDEDDAAIARLILPSRAKITKAVVV